VDTEELHRQSFNQAFLDFELRWNWSPDVYTQLLAVSGGPDRIRAYIARMSPSAAEKARLQSIVHLIHREKTRIYGEIVGSNVVRLRAGVARLIGEARQAGLKIGIAATSASTNVQSLVSTLFGPDSYTTIGPIVCVDEVNRPKPAPDLYEMLLKMLGLPAAACVAFEDSANGLAAAKAAGLFTIVTPTRWTQMQDLSAADVLIPSLDDPGDPLDPKSAARIGDAPHLGLTQVTALHAAGMTAAALDMQENGAPIRSRVTPVPRNR
jgi:beta-phosphoglucomutase-like phosphatase (HAD superfamily)